MAALRIPPEHPLTTKGARPSSMVYENCHGVWPDLPSIHEEHQQMSCEDCHGILPHMEEGVDCATCHTIRPHEGMNCWGCHDPHKRAIKGLS